MIEHIYLCAKKEGYKNLYISTDQKGLYENFGFKFLQKMNNRRNEMSLVYKMDCYLNDKNYSDEEILSAVSLQEQYFISELYR